ncbi:MAG: triose-phosphate isomerase [Cyclobacteriaceae bacterium]|nr:triose-phosphate isomerase [Cyclobacteriaceae bacterium]
MRTKIVAGNWKMNKTLPEALQLTAELLMRLDNHQVKNIEVVIIPPFPYLIPVSEKIQSSVLRLGAQNCSEHPWGAYTGEVSAPMLKSVGVHYVIIGHSERRQYFGEEGTKLAQKVDAVLANQLHPIFCCGEPLIVRGDGRHFDLVKLQIEEALFHLPAEALLKTIIAYEPVWAIGTGKTATPEQAQEMHAFIREQLTLKYGAAVAQQVRILYGGSVNAGNAKALFACADVDGGLVGGASLKAGEFFEIIQAAAQ